MAIDVEVAILGAGPAGCATALAVLQGGVHGVAIVDRPRRQAFSVGESATPDVAAKLKQLGLQDDLGARGHRPYHANVSLWAGQRRLNDFLHRAVGHGWHLDRTRFDKDLRVAACENGSLLLTPAVLDELSWDQNQWRLQINHEGKQQRLNCRFIVDASGRGATISKHLGVEHKRLDSLVALVCKTPDGTALEGRTLVESMADGWWYATCLPDGSALVALMSDADLIRQRGWRDGEKFRAQWDQTEELRHWLQLSQDIKLIPSSFAAHSGFLTQATGPGWIAVGDALASFDPLTSSGISNALGDGLAAAPVITHWLNKNSLEAAEHYALRANNGLSRYLKEWQRHYGAERRWANQHFWLRRRKVRC